MVGLCRRLLSVRSLVRAQELEQYMKKIPQKQMSGWIGTIGYDIIDRIISPVCGISGVVADLYVCDILLYADDDKQAERIVRKVCKKYSLPITLVQTTTPIALIALMVIEHGKY